VIILGELFMRIIILTGFIFIIVLTFIPFVHAENIKPPAPTELRADSVTNIGWTVKIKWKSPVIANNGANTNNNTPLSPSNSIAGYEIQRTKDPNSGVWEDRRFLESRLQEFISGEYQDMSWFSDGNIYYYRMRSINKDNIAGEWSELSNPVTIDGRWFDSDKIWLLIIGIIISMSIIIYIELAKRQKKLFIRNIAALSSIEEAIGRSTEMGKPIVYVPGILDVNDVQTLSGLIILQKVSKMVAEYDTKINVPVSKSLVLTTGREMVKEAYISAGRPDAYTDDIVHYVAEEQFAYVAGINGIIVREKPATVFYMGAFFAESLILAETGNTVGAIQIAGTAMPAQLPFFIAACDYTLIGEELFAASAYLSGDPQLLGSLKGQDIGKIIAMTFILLGMVFSTLAVIFSGSDLISIVKGSSDAGFFGEIIKFLKDIFTVTTTHIKLGGM